MTIHIYRRVSTTGQAGEDRSSLADQERMCRGAAMMQGEEAPLDWCDPGVSGSVPLAERPQGGQMLAAMRPGDTVIAAKMDRMFRSASDALTTAESFLASGIGLILLDCGADPVTKGASKLFFTVLAAVAEFEKGRLLERMADGQKGKRHRGGHVGGDAPYGFRIEGRGRDAVLLADDTEQEAISRARRLREGGASLREIGRQLASEGHLTRAGKPWEAMQVSRLLKGDQANGR
jgi:DNA invertase Pin-like site-specific DNA recombinase